MPNPFEVASPFDEAQALETLIDVLAEEVIDARSSEINARRAAAEHSENLRLARAL
ncbi:hypothetical protein [Phenylobacterium sp.]|uniref:hypothetical protein n=1 Tax=Phenylobacterium sp. TaxID=1871053 RepID=UPI0035B074B0